MTSVNKNVLLNTQSCANSTTKPSIIISNISIRQDTEGRFSLNDLHKASGSEQRHQPRYWLALDQTNELINEILNSGITLFNSQPTYVKKGRYGGTYVCKELVYSYAMWISAAFALKVIRAYDSLVSGDIQQAESIAKTTVEERTPLRDAVNMLVSKKHLKYPDAYAMIHQRFNVSSIEDLSSDQIPTAIEYVHRVVLEGELLTKPQNAQELSARDINNLVWLWDYANRAQALFRTLYPALSQLKSQYAGDCYDYSHEFSSTIELARRTLLNMPHVLGRDSAWGRLQSRALPPSSV